MKRIDVLTVFILILMFAACKKDKRGCADEDSLCVLVEDGNLEGSTNIMSNYLASLIGTDNHKLAKLKDWLECKRCVEEVYMPCFSCIEEPTPPRTISIDFIQQGRIVNMEMVLRLDGPLESSVVITNN